MGKIVNLSSFKEQALFAVDCTGQDLLVVCVAGRFKLPPAGHGGQHELALADEQATAPMTDVYWGEPGASSLRYEGQSAFYRPGTDIYVSGHAHSPAGCRAQQLCVRVQVGSIKKTLAVFGDRVWYRSWTAVRSSAPQPFERMPLRYERSFGGAPGSGKHQWEPRNPVGCGLYDSAAAACDRPLPNLEDPAQLITDWSDRVAPAGVGPICRAWGPRLKLAGSYDTEWVQSRAPLWPRDLNLGFFHAAAPGLTAVP